MGHKGQNEKDQHTPGLAQLTCALRLLEVADPPAQLSGRRQKLPRRSSEGDSGEVMERSQRQDLGRGQGGQKPG